MTPDELRANVDTIVIVMMENRSFDHMLGHLRLPQFGNRTELEGIDSLDNPAFANPSQNGTMIAPFLATDDPPPNDLPHERPFVAQQIAWAPAIQSFAMNGFVAAYERSTGTSGTLSPPPMGILQPQYVPTTDFLAREYTVCDHWFAPIPTSTQPNRLMAFSGYTTRDSTVSGLLPDQDLVFDWLNRNNVRWRVYSAGLSFFALFPKMIPKLVTDDFLFLSRLSFDVQKEDPATFPQVIFVEPDYDDSPIHLSGHACDNHPPVPVGFGEAFLQTVYEALTSNPTRWAKTLLIVTHDEHGGFFDHVAPLPVTNAPPAGEYAAHTSTGPRVPAILAGPFVQRGGVCSAALDHTSVLQLLAERFGNGAPYSDSVESRRTQGIASVSTALAVGARTAAATAPAPKLVMPRMNLTAPIETMRDARTAGQKAFEAAVNELAKDGAALKKFPEIAHWLAAP